MHHESVNDYRPKAIEPKWVHGERTLVEPARLLSVRELAERVCAAFACPSTPHLSSP
jgi:hypothetical protein